MCRNPGYRSTHLTSQQRLIWKVFWKRVVSVWVCVRIWSSFLPFLQLASNYICGTTASSSECLSWIQDITLFCTFCMQYESEATAKQNPNPRSLQISCCSPGEPIRCWHPPAKVPFLPSSSRKSLYQQLARPLWPQCVTSFRMVAGLAKL